MKVKRNIKIILDVIMLIASLTLFSKQFISMNYHEIAGLVLVGLVIVHIVINTKTIVAMTKKFMKVPLSIKVGLVVDILLIICYGLIGVSGIFISKTILTSISSTNMIFKMMHMFISALSVILLGIHMGLHFCRKEMQLKKAIVASVIIFVCGIYGLFCSSELRWLSTPFMMSSAPQEGMKGNGEGPGMGGHGNGMMRGERPDNENNSDSDISKGDFEDKLKKSDFEGRRNGQGFEGKDKNRQSSSVVQKIQTVIMFLGMILSFSMITYWIVIFKKKAQNNICIL